MEEKTYLTVTALTKYIKYKFDHDVHLKNVYLQGEISNFKHHSRGHFYFTLKDDKAQISAIMFASSASKVIFKPEDGMSVLVNGYISVYEQGGSYQIYVKEMTEAGLGDLYVAYEQLKKKLEEEGLFDPKHKKPIPKFPKTIGVLTSPTGAAVRDVINIINRRYPLSKIIVYPTLVQGEYAKDNIVENIQKANNDGLVDVIILGRGGGSIEDLWPFNEEQVAYAIFASKVPIISSVGHETDFTISDFVADLRAPTPSGGAELAVPNKVDLHAYIKALEDRMNRALKNTVVQNRKRLERIQKSYVLTDPLRLTEAKNRQLDFVTEKLQLLNPLQRIKQGHIDVNQLTIKLTHQFEKQLQKKRSRFELLLSKLDLVSPLNIMKKGYGIIKQNNQVIVKTTDIKEQQPLDITLEDGIVHTNVISIERNEE